MLEPGSSSALQREREAPDLTFARLTPGSAEPGGKEGSVVHPPGAVAADASQAKRGGSAGRPEVILLNGILAVGREAKAPLFS